MKWDVNSTEIPMLMIRLTSETPFNSMDDVCMPDSRWSMMDMTVSVNTKWFVHVFNKRETVRMTTTVRREDDNLIDVSVHVLREGIRFPVTFMTCRNNNCSPQKLLIEGVESGVGKDLLLHVHRLGPVVDLCLNLVGDESGSLN